MNAQVIIGKAVYTIRNADHLHVDGDLIEIQRSLPAGYETVAVAGTDMLVTIAPTDYADEEFAAPDGGSLWHPVGEPLD
ncbi:MAG TPA: hypothetical protein VOB72_21610 [Candidatus Dormibacteraeota bacterium]|nr:hypothetical protein [Candidatus Dormibacteraeota bacterium]